MHREINIGIDVGSTTVKAVVLAANTNEPLYRAYRRHGVHQAKCVLEELRAINKSFPDARANLMLTGSGASPLSDVIGAPYIQEVVANSIAVRRFHPTVRTAIELGGQDAKMVFFGPTGSSGKSTVSDMRMNGSCAGGTGAFIDEIATLLNTPVEEFNALASQGARQYAISGRCGVYAKTDIQPLLNQGASRADIALSVFHAVAKQTIGGLAQGLDILPPVIFEGGPFTFNPRLIEVFKERLSMTDADIVKPEHPEVFVAQGAALAASEAKDETARTNLEQVLDKLQQYIDQEKDATCDTKPLLSTDEERTAFKERHALPSQKGAGYKQPRINAYLGIDSGSTTTKIALVDEDGTLLDSFYASNKGEPLEVARQALIDMRQRIAQSGTQLTILGVGTTGYGEKLMFEAFGADHHVVETVAHAKAACETLPNASFILDIGGQDMKAIWLADGVVTDIVVNEACSSGCGSFLESFASSLNIPVRQIAERAFASKSPAELGSRCTVFMNSSIVTEQRRGKTSDDIMAGLCRSIIENVFTKVIRVSNLDSLGQNIVVQGGTFLNDAVLCAFEQYVGKQVQRAPYPGLMGAIGAALLTRDRMEHLRAQQPDLSTSFIGLDALEEFTYTQDQNNACPFCSNHCRRVCVTFSSGKHFVTGNRCPKGEVVGDPHDQQVREALKSAIQNIESVPNLFETRKQLLFQEYPFKQLCSSQNLTLGLPRVLALWDNAPFWTTFLRTLGFTVVLSDCSNRAIYEDGLPAVTSDTVCFPAKLVHGHIRNLASKGVDRIFMPIITVVKSECTEKTAQSMCAVVKGYPMVIANSDNPQQRFGVPFDTPLWHWYTPADREKQLCAYFQSTYSVPKELVIKAIQQADQAQASFRAQLQAQAAHVIEECAAAGTYAVIVASRPYQNDDLVNHDIPKLFVEQGVPVLTADSVPGFQDVDLSHSRIDVANNFHARMLSTALIAARSPHLEYAQVVNFNCGHDAYLSDEIARLMHEAGGKAPLILKVDESDIQGPLRIRVRSFVETIGARHNSVSKNALVDPYHSKFTMEMVGEKTVLVPNTSHAFSMLMAAAFAGQGLKTQPMEVGREEAIRLGKKYVHNDICFPCQIVIGEALATLESGQYDPDHVAIAMGKYIGDCRLTQYTALLRKALDDAGYPQVPIVTNDDQDRHNVHPGFKMNLLCAMRIAYGLPMIDALEELLRKMRPYELEPGSAQRAFDQALQLTMDGLRNGGIRGMKKGFSNGVDLMCAVRYDRSRLRPRVLIVGEYLLNFHPGANRDVEKYLEKNGMEVVEARMTDVIRKSYFYRDRQIREYALKKPASEKALLHVESEIFNLAHDCADRIAAKHPLYQPAARMQDIVKASDPIVHHTFDAGEGVLIPAEILHHAKDGCRAFIILQPFGCLPNHVVGRGITKKLKELYPDATILPLDYDPDMAQANIENRLQMLIMDARARRDS